MSEKVAVAKYPGLKGALSKIGGIESFVRSGDKVFLKPNACAPKSSDSGAVTSPGLIAETVRLFKEITDDITVGDSPFVGFKGMLNLRVSGIMEAAERAGAKVVDLNKAKRVKVGSFHVAEAVVDADVLVNMPVMKTHERTGVTLSLKNIMGVIPGNLKHEVHKRGLEQQIVELNKWVRPNLIIVDANLCQEGSGPLNGTPKKLGLIVVGINPVSVDSFCCKLMGIDPTTIKHLRMAADAGLGDLNGYEAHGFDEKYVSPFTLPKTYSNFLLKSAMEVSEAPIQRFLERYNRIEFNYDKCTKCGLCAASCPEKNIVMTDKGPVCDHSRCTLCLCCFETCMDNAIGVKETFYGKPLIGLIRKVLSSKAEDNEYIS